MGQIETNYHTIQYWYPDVIEEMKRKQRKSSSNHRNTPLNEWKFVYNWAELIDAPPPLTPPLEEPLPRIRHTPLEERIQKRLRSVLVCVEAKPRDRKSRACISYGPPEWQSDPENNVFASPDQIPSPVIAQVVTEEIGNTSNPLEVTRWVRARTPSYIWKHPTKLLSRVRQMREDDALEICPEPETRIRLERHFDHVFASWFAGFQLPTTVLCLRPELITHIQMLYDRLYELMWSFVTERRSEFIEEWKADERAREEDLDRDGWLSSSVAETSFIIQQWAELLPIGEAERDAVSSYLYWKDPSEKAKWLCYALLKPEVEAALKEMEKIQS